MLLSPLIEELLKLFNDFATTTWGKPNALLKSDPTGHYPYLDLSQHFRAFSYLFQGRICHDRLLVRDEYRAAADSLQDRGHYPKGAYVIGQPGVGKSLFLIYALALFLGQEQGVMLQVQHGFYLFFKDTVSVHETMDARPLFDPSTKWALADSNESVQTPPDVFCGNPTQVQVVQVCSPRICCWKGWTKEYGAEPWYMDVWTKREIGFLAEISRIDVNQLLALADEWGGVPRILLAHAREKRQVFEARYRDLAIRAVAALQKSPHLLAQGRLGNLPESFTSAFFHLRPRVVDGNIERKLGYVYVPTWTLWYLLCEALQAADTLQKLNFIRLMSQCPETRGGAGAMYEDWCHTFLCAKQNSDLPCGWVASEDMDGNALQLGIAGLTRSTQSTLSTNDPPYYWIPIRKNFAGIDSALVLETEVIAIQITIGATHKPPHDGLKKLRRYLGPEQRKLPWKMIFIGEEENQIKKVAHKCGGMISYPKDKRIPVGWAVISPMGEKIAMLLLRSGPVDV